MRSRGAGSGSVVRRAEAGGAVVLAWWSVPSTTAAGAPAGSWERGSTSMPMAPHTDAVSGPASRRGGPLGAGSWNRRGAGAMSRAVGLSRRYTVESPSPADDREDPCLSPWVSRWLERGPLDRRCGSNEPDDEARSVGPCASRADPTPSAEPDGACSEGPLADSGSWAGGLSAGAGARASEGGARRDSLACGTVGASSRSCVEAIALADSFRVSATAGGSGRGAVSPSGSALAKASGTGAGDGSDGCCACGTAEPASDGGSLRLRGEPVIDMACRLQCGWKRGSQAGACAKHCGRGQQRSCQLRLERSGRYERTARSARRVLRRRWGVTAPLCPLAARRGARDARWGRCGSTTRLRRSAAAPFGVATQSEPLSNSRQSQGWECCGGRAHL